MALAFFLSVFGYVLYTHDEGPRHHAEEHLSKLRAEEPTAGKAKRGELKVQIEGLEKELRHLDAHWNGHYYQSVLPVPTDDHHVPYDPNIDIVQAAVYGAESVTDPSLLATAALLRAQWADSSSAYFYPINGADAAQGLGPLLGRYPGDVYDGDTDAQVGDHPWALTTANFAELYYRLAAKISSSRTVPADSLAEPFLAQVGLTETSWKASNGLP